MLNIDKGLNVDEAFAKLKEIKESAAHAEPESQRPTDEAVSLPAEPEEILADDEEVEQPEESEGEAVESEQDEEVAADDEQEPSDEDDFVIELDDGREVTLSEVREWEKGYLRLQDYTRKTQELAEQRKQVEEQAQKLSQVHRQLAERVDELEALVKTSEEDIDWDELREIDPAEYLAQKEKLERRKKALEEAKKQQAGISQEVLQQKMLEEQKKLLELNKDWLDESGRPTKKYEQDAKLARDYLNELGVSEQEQAMIIDHRLWQAILDAARFRAAKKTGASVKKRVRKAPKVSKPSGAQKSSVQAELEKAKARLARTGSIEDALLVRRLTAKLKQG